MAEAQPVVRVVTLEEKKKRAEKFTPYLEHLIAGKNSQKSEKEQKDLLTKIAKFS